MRECLGHKISITKAARIAGVDYESVIWINKYENEGIEGFNSKEQKIHTSETKTAAVIEYLQGGGSQQEICKKYGIRGKDTLQVWIKVYNAHGDFDSVKHSGGGSYMKRGRETTKEERILYFNMTVDRKKFSATPVFPASIPYYLMSGEIRARK